MSDRTASNSIWARMIEFASVQSAPFSTQARKMTFCCWNGLNVVVGTFAQFTRIATLSIVVGGV